MMLKRAPNYPAQFLQGIVDRLKSFAEEAMASPDVSDEHKELLARELRRLAYSRTPGGAALVAAFTIGAFAQNPIARVREMQRHTQPGRKKNLERSDKENAPLVMMYERGDDFGQIAKVMKISKPAVDKRIRRLITKGKLRPKS